MLQANYTTAFNRDLKRLSKQGKDMSLLSTVMNLLINEVPLDARYKDHPLTGNWLPHREWHVTSNWLLIYRYEPRGIVFARSGNHHDLFGK